VECLEGRTLLSFGTGGVVTTQVNGSEVSQGFAVAIQAADQKIVAGGDTQYPDIFALARYNTDGTLDSTFGSKGVVTTSFGNSDYPQVNSILVQPSNGKIVAGGIEYYLNTRTYSYQAQFVLARYTASGSLDSTFGKGGKVTTLFPSYGGYGQAGINTVLLRSDGEIVAVGGANESAWKDDYVALALYKSNGALDTSFGSSGTAVDTSLDTSTSSPNSGGGTTTVYTYFSPSGGALESDNSILVAGSHVTETTVTNSSGTLVSDTINESDLALVHYLTTGMRDSSFGTNGIVITPITPTGVTMSNASGSNVLVQPNGAIVEVGTAAGPNGHTDFLLARYNANGSPDTSFGGVGYALVDLGATSSGDSVVLQPNGQIVAAGLVGTSFNQSGAGATSGFATVRLNTDGSPDTTFGTGGAVITQVLYDDLYAVAAGLETINGQTMIVDAGTAQLALNNGTEDFALVRYNPASLDATIAAASASPNPVNYGQSVTLTATVTANASGAPTPTGSFDFFDTTTGKDLGSANLSGGVAALSIKPTLPIGTQTITVSYSGDGNSLRSTTNVTITVARITNSLLLSASPNPSNYGQSVTFTAAVSANPQPATPTGSVDFFDTTTNTDLGSVTLAAGSAALTTSALPVGTQTIMASYSGDGNYLASTSSVTVTVNSGSASPALSTQAASTTTGLMGIISMSSPVNPPLSSLSIGPVGSAPAAAPTIPEPGLVLQALESPDFLETVLPGRRRQ